METGLPLKLFHYIYFIIYFSVSWNISPHSTDSGTLPSLHQQGRIRDPVLAPEK